MVWHGFNFYGYISMENKIKIGSMNKNILHIAQVAAKFFFDLEPELTELLIAQAVASSSKAAGEVLPVITEAYNSHKTRVIQFFNRDAESQYRAA